MKCDHYKLMDTLRGERAEEKETEKRDLIIIDKLEKALNTRNPPRARIGS